MTKSFLLSNKKESEEHENEESASYLISCRLDSSDPVSMRKQRKSVRRTEAREHFLLAL